VLTEEPSGQRRCTAPGSGRNDNESPSPLTLQKHSSGGYTTPAICPGELPTAAEYIVSPLDNMLTKLDGMAVVRAQYISSRIALKPIVPVLLSLFNL